MPRLLPGRFLRAKVIGALLVACAVSSRPLDAQQTGANGTWNEAIAQFYYTTSSGNYFHWHDCYYGPVEPCGPGPQSDVNSLTAATADGSYG